MSNQTKFSPEFAALSMAGSSIIVAVNALPLRRVKLEDSTDADDEPLQTAGGHALRPLSQGRRKHRDPATQPADHIRLHSAGPVVSLNNP